jgi:hypothetical protein
MFFSVSLGFVMGGSIILLLHYLLKAKSKKIISYLSVKTDKKEFIQNERLRDESTTIFDIVLSDEADFTKRPEGQKLLEAIRSFN